MTDAKADNDDVSMVIAFIIAGIILFLIVAAGASMAWDSYQRTKSQIDTERTEQVEGWIAQHPKLRELVQKRLESDCKDQAAPCLSNREFDEIQERYQSLRRAQSHDQLEKAASRSSSEKTNP